MTCAAAGSRTRGASGIGPLLQSTTMIGDPLSEALTAGGKITSTGLPASVPAPSATFRPSRRP